MKSFIGFVCLAATCFLAACSPQAVPSPTRALNPVTSTSDRQAAPHTATPNLPTASPTRQILPSSTPVPPSLINLYNRYLGKSTQRQPELILTPPVSIVPISDADGYDRSYVSILLGGKQVNGDEIRGAPVMLAHLIQMFDAAYRDVQASVTILSSYRSYEDQEYLRQTGGDENEDNFLAPPGRSEHQLGTAVDLAWNAERLNFYLMNVYPKAREFYNWLKENAHQYGFILSYPFKSTSDQSVTNLLEPYVTEYKAEPWHLRYVGLELAAKIYAARDEQGRGYLDPLSDLIPQQFMLPAPAP